MSAADLRVVTEYAVTAASEVLELFERAHPGDGRAAAAVEAGRRFAAGEPRSQKLRAAAVDAHRAGRTSTGAASHAALAAGDAAASAYLHPLAKPTQVRHILGAAAHTARATELAADDEHSVGDARLQRFVRETPLDLVTVLLRYPPPPVGKNRVARLLGELDAGLREGRG